MAVHLSLNEDDLDITRLLPFIPLRDVCSTTVTLTASGSRMPGNYLTVWLAHPRGFPCRRRRVLRVVDCTQEQNDEHDRALLASESYDVLRELHWSSYRFCLPFLLDFLSLTPNLQRLHVHVLKDLVTTLAEIVPERPSWPRPDPRYTFSLVSFECSAILTADLISGIIACSQNTLQHLYLLIHSSQFNILVTELADIELLSLSSLTIVPADQAFRPARLLRFLLHFPRLGSLAIAVDHPADAQRCAAHTPFLHDLTLYCAHRLCSMRAVQSFEGVLPRWSRMRTLQIVIEGFRSEDARVELHRICATARVALRVIVFRPSNPPGLDDRGLTHVSYAGMPRV